MRTVQFSLRLLRDDAAALRRIADRTHGQLSANQVAAAFIHRAIEENWTVQPGPAGTAVGPGQLPRGPAPATDTQEGTK